jgi:hypothetical protein
MWNPVDHIARNRRARAIITPTDRRDEIAFCLLDRLPMWRERSVEQIEITNALWSQRERVVTVKPLRRVDYPPLQEALDGLLREVQPGQQAPTSASLLLPLVSLPKDPLFDFRMSVNGVLVTRVRRDNSGLFQAGYIKHLAKEAGYDEEIKPRLLELLTQICRFASSAWEQYRKEHKQEGAQIRDLQHPLRAYIELTRKRRVEQPDYEAWVGSWARIKGIVLKHTLPSHKSAAQNPLLVIPKLSLTDQEVTWALQELRKLLAWAQGKDDEAQKKIDRGDKPSEAEKAASRLVSTYASYGRRWEALARCTVPLNTPFMIKVREERIIHFDSPKSEQRGPWAWLHDRLTTTAYHHIAFHDAQSNHVHVRVADQHVQLVARKSWARNDKWERLTVRPQIANMPDDERRNHEYYSCYDSRDTRDERIWIACRLRQAMTRWYMTWGMVLATLSAIALLVYFSVGFGRYETGHELDSSDVVAVLIPVTITASLTLARESTTLGMRVKRVVQFLLMVSLLALWGLTFAFYLWGRISVDGTTP